MKLYPTIHIKNGKCYNPLTAPLAVQNIYTNNPVKLARTWQSLGASYIHVVDVDGATLGSMVHEELIAEMVQAVTIPIQVGGGIRSIKDIDHYLNMGIARVVCSTKAAQSLNFVKEAVDLFGSEHFVAGIDSRDGMVMIEGREKLSSYNPISLALELKNYGVTRLIYTDVISSSMHRGPSLENSRELVTKVGMQIIIAGGITSFKDLEDISTLPIEGIIIASSLYNGTVDLSQAINYFEKGLKNYE